MIRQWPNTTNIPIFFLILSMLIICPNHSWILATDVSLALGITFARQKQRGRNDTRQLFSSAYFFSADYLLNTNPVKLFLAYFDQNWAAWQFWLQEKLDQWESSGNWQGREVGNRIWSAVDPPLAIPHLNSIYMDDIHFFPQGKIPQRLIRWLSMAPLLTTWVVCSSLWQVSCDHSRSEDSKLKQKAFAFSTHNIHCGEEMLSFCFECETWKHTTVASVTIYLTLVDNNGKKPSSVSYLVSQSLCSMLLFQNL